MNTNNTFLVVFFVLFIVMIYILNPVEGFFTSPYTYDSYVSPTNSFRNYYRTEYLYDKSLGWKPVEEWDYLTPENNECSVLDM